MSKVGAERDHSFNPDIPVPRPIEPLDAPPHLEFFPAHPGRTAGTRTAADIFSVVVHATAADNPATSTGAFFQSPPEDPKDVGSAQLTVDNDLGIRSVADLGIANGVPPLNQEGLHIEQRGLGEFPREKWLGERRNTMLRCAFHVAKWCTTFDIPIRFLEVADLEAEGEKARGITTHANVSNAFGESTHQDPGPDYPIDVLLEDIERFARGDEMTDEEKAQLAEALRSAQRFEDYLKGENSAIVGDSPPDQAAAKEVKRGYHNTHRVMRFAKEDEMTDEEKAQLAEALRSAQRFEDYLKGENSAIAGDSPPDQAAPDAFKRGFQNAHRFLRFAEEDEMTDEEKAQLAEALRSAQRFEDYLKGENSAIAGDSPPDQAAPDAFKRGFQNAQRFLR